MQYVYPVSRNKRYRFPTHCNELVMCRSDATASEVFVVVLQPGEAPPMHYHDDTEQIFFVMEGRGRLEVGLLRETYEIKSGDVVRIPVSTDHRVFCEGTQPLRYLTIDCFPAGTPESEPTWDIHARIMCKNNGWDYDQVLAV